MISTRPFEHSTPVLVVLIAQMITAVMMLVGLIASSQMAAANITQLPPTSVIYSVEALAWVGSGQIAAHLIIAVVSLIFAAITMRAAWRSDNQAISTITMIAAAQAMLGAFVNVSLAFAVMYGSWWHISSAAAVALFACSSAGSIAFIVPALSSLATPSTGREPQ